MHKADAGRFLVVANSWDNDTIITSDPCNEAGETVFLDIEGTKLGIALGIIVIEGGRLGAIDGFRVMVGVLLEYGVGTKDKDGMILGS